MPRVGFFLRGVLRVDTLLLGFFFDEAFETFLAGGFVCFFAGILVLL